MAIAATSCEIVYTCNGSLQDFSFNFPIFVQGDLKIYQITIATGAQVLMTLNSDYTLSASLKNEDYSSGGTVHTVTAWSSSYKIRVVRDLTKIQSLILSEGQSIRADSLMRALDRITLEVQEVMNAIKTTPSLSGGDIGCAFRAMDVINTTITNAYVVAGGQSAATKNTGWIKIKVGEDIAWIPYWLNSTP